MYKRKYIFIIFLAFFLVLIQNFFLPRLTITRPFSYVLYADNNVLLDASVSENEEWHFPLFSDSLPTKLTTCILISEDKRFYWHKGVDIPAILRSAYINLKHKKIKSGASTITMQVARMYYNVKKRSYLQKVKEILLAWYLEIVYSKKEILKMYLENAPFGGNVVGAEAASWRYFGQSLHSLSWAESALLAILPNNPSNINLDKNRQLLKLKRNKLLFVLYKQKIIDRNTYQLSIEEEIPTYYRSIPHHAPHLLQFLKTKYPDKYVYETTLNEYFQKEIYQILERKQEEYKSNNIRNAAVMVVEVKTGKVVTYIGNYHNRGATRDAYYVNNIEANRSSGSVLKPLLYLTMLDNGELLPDMLIPDVPIQIGGYAPKNFNRGYDGAIQARYALARSLNVPAVKMLQWYGIQRFIDFLHKMGFTTITRPQDYYGLSLILGGCEVKLSELVRAYHYLAWKLQYENSDGFRQSYIKNNAEKQSIFISNISKGAIWLTFDAMVEVERPKEEQWWYLFSSKQKVAWKTGTSFGFRDAWSIGVTPDYVIGVWVGNSTGEGSAELTGIKKAAPILFEIVNLLYPKATGWFSMPYDDLQLVETCKQSGHPASVLCDDKIKTIAPKTFIKVRPCPYHKIVFLDSTGTYRVNSECESPFYMKKETFFVLPPTMEYYFKKHNIWYRVLPPYRNDCKEWLQGKNFDIVYPQQYTKVFIPRNLDGSLSSVLFELSHRYPKTRVFWYLDSKFLGETINRHQMPINAAKGKHVLTIVDEYGESKQIDFEVLNSQD